MPVNSVNLSADLLKAGDLSPVKAEVSQSIVNHAERADKSSQTPRDNASHTEREVFLWIGTERKKERLYEKQIREWGKKRNELKMTVNHLWGFEGRVVYE